MKVPHVLFFIVLALAAGFVGGRLGHNNTSAEISTSVDKHYDRVLRSGTLRCGWAVAPTYFERDPNTGEFSGIWYDYVERLGKSLSLQIDWAQETTYGQVGEDLKAGRYDVYCAGLWPNAPRARSMDFVTPISFRSIVAAVRPTDQRFDNNLAAINDPSIKVSVIDGEIASLIRAADFPRSSVVSLPQASEFSSLLRNVVTGKADVTLTSPNMVHRFNTTNSNTLKIVPAPRPVRLFAEVLAVAADEVKLRRMLSAATQELLYSGVIETILEKYNEDTEGVLRIAAPFESPNNLVRGASRPSNGRSSPKTNK